MTIEQALQRALEHHRAGRLAEAEEIYRQVVGQDQRHAGALHLLGVLTCQTNRARAAIDLIGRAIAINPAVAEYHSDLGEAQRRVGELEAAVASFDRALAIKPDVAMTHYNLGNALLTQGHAGRAAAAYSRAIELKEDVAGFHANLGIALNATGQYDEAIRAYGRALALGPGDSRVHSNLGVALREAGLVDESLAAFRRSIAIDDKDAGVHCNLAGALLEAGRLDEAIAACNIALTLEPDHAEAHYKLGCARQLKGELDQAIALLRRATTLKPDHVQAHNNLGVALLEAMRLDEARAPLDRAIALDPNLAVAHTNLGNVFWIEGRLDEALDSFRRACALKPQDAKLASDLLFNLHAHPDYDAPALLAEHRLWASRFAAPLAAQVRPHANDRSANRMLRIGYLSPDLRAHPVGHLLLPLFSHHDPSVVAIHAYADLRTPDRVSRELKAHAQHWLDTQGLTDTQLADRIRSDRIDILVDLALHTPSNRMLVFARKPAPVQVTMLGLPSTTGLATMDYRLTDPYLDPLGVSDAHYTERSIRLPHCFWIFPLPDAAPPVSALPAQSNGFVTFGCLNQLIKVSQPVLKLWRTILQSVPDSRLVLHSPPGRHCETLRSVFEEAGVAGARVEFVPRVGRHAYFSRYLNLDLALDPFPYCGGTTTMDALWMGVPVITLAGRTAVGRGGVSILTNLGLTELIAQTPEQYAAIALDWARDPARLATLRSSLRQRMVASPLMDAKQYARDVEAAFRRMWQRWCGA